jgi:hypothetical protein
MARIKLLLALSLVSPLALGVAVLGEPGQRGVDDPRPQPGPADGRVSSSPQVSAPTLDWADPPEAQRYRASTSSPVSRGEPGWIDPAPNPAETRIVVELPEPLAAPEIPPAFAPTERAVATSVEPSPDAAPSENKVVVELPVPPAAPEIPPVIASAEPIEPAPETKAPTLPSIAALSALPAERSDATPAVAVRPAPSAPRVRAPTAEPPPRTRGPALRARIEPNAERVKPPVPPPARVTARVVEEPIRLRLRERVPVVLPPQERKPRLARVPPTRPPRLDVGPQTPDLPSILKPDAKLWDSAS